MCRCCMCCIDNARACHPLWCCAPCIWLQYCGLLLANAEVFQVSMTAGVRVECNSHACREGSPLSRASWQLCTRNSSSS